MSRVISFINLTGGVGRTTSAVSMAVAFSEYGKRVLLVDLDPNGGASFSLGLENPRLSATEIFSGRPRALGMIYKTADRIDVIPANLTLEAAALKSAAKKDGEYILQKALENLEYDVIIIDAPATNSYLAKCAIVAATEFIIPTRLDILSMRGVFSAIELIDKPENKKYQILPTMVESRNKTQGLISTDLNSRYGELVISPGIAKWGGFAEAVGAGKSALSLFKTSDGAASYREITYPLL
ncbi:cobyrinic acid a,c-diamide synthase [Actinomycetes bacterium]|nr:cobyrinic acid a,c-diamide synthase [Actinomycetes bacterium]